MQPTIPFSFALLNIFTFYPSPYTLLLKAFWYTNQCYHQLFIKNIHTFYFSKKILSFRSIIHPITFNTSSAIKNAYSFIARFPFSNIHIRSPAYNPAIIKNTPTSMVYSIMPSLNNKTIDCTTNSEYVIMSLLSLIFNFINFFECQYRITQTTK